MEIIALCMKCKEKSAVAFSGQKRYCRDCMQLPGCELGQPDEPLTDVESPAPGSNLNKEKAISIANEFYFHHSKIDCLIALLDREFDPDDEMNDFLPLLKVIWEKTKNNFEKITDSLSQDIGKSEIPLTKEISFSCVSLEDMIDIAWLPIDHLLSFSNRDYGPGDEMNDLHLVLETLLEKIRADINEEVKSISKEIGKITILKNDEGLSLNGKWFYPRELLYASLEPRDENAAE
jgi:hypothetical protein